MQIGVYERSREYKETCRILVEVRKNIELRTKKQRQREKIRSATFLGTEELENAQPQRELRSLLKAGSQNCRPQSCVHIGMHKLATAT